MVAHQSASTMNAMDQSPSAATAAEGSQSASAGASADASADASAGSVSASKGKKPRKAASGQREMLLPISGKRAKEEPGVQAPKKAEKPVRTAAVRSKKAG